MSRGEVLLLGSAGCIVWCIAWFGIVNFAASLMAESRKPDTTVPLDESDEPADAA